jgi:hypothetical protein
MKQPGDKPARLTPVQVDELRRKYLAGATIDDLVNNYPDLPVAFIIGAIMPTAWPPGDETPGDVDETQ